MFDLCRENPPEPSIRFPSRTTTGRQGMSSKQILDSLSIDDHRYIYRPRVQAISRSSPTSPKTTTQRSACDARKTQRRERPPVA